MHSIPLHRDWDLNLIVINLLWLVFCIQLLKCTYKFCFLYVWSNSEIMCVWGGCLNLNNVKSHNCTRCVDMMTCFLNMRTRRKWFKSMFFSSYQIFGVSSKVHFNLFGLFFFRLSCFSSLKWSPWVLGSRFDRNRLSSPCIRCLPIWGQGNGCLWSLDFFWLSFGCIS